MNLWPFGSEQVSQAKAGEAECLTHMHHLITVLHITIVFLTMQQLLLKPKFTD